MHKDKAEQELKHQKDIFFCCHFLYLLSLLFFLFYILININKLKKKHEIDKLEGGPSCNLLQLASLHMTIDMLFRLLLLLKKCLNLTEEMKRYLIEKRCHTHNVSSK
jgi:hypothetical protein